ncbi:TPA: hypothetical protein OZG65_002578 [Staphylococcus aureus]|jgi:hypothetical protein|nr:hypothetical protein [Staphylococcus aureus]
MGLFKQNTENFVLLSDIKQAVKNQYKGETIPQKEEIRKIYNLNHKINVELLSINLDIQQRDVPRRVHGLLKIEFLEEKGIRIMSSCECPFEVRVDDRKVIYRGESSSIDAEESRKIKKAIDNTIYEIDYYKANYNLLKNIFIELTPND